jgi:hypothetical protein
MDSGLAIQAFFKEREEQGDGADALSENRLKKVNKRRAV